MRDIYCGSSSNALERRYCASLYIQGGGLVTSDVKYTADANVLYIRLSNEPIDHGEDCGQIIVHLSSEDRPVALEVLDASEFVHDVLRAMLDREPELSKLEFPVELHIQDVVKKLVDDIKGHANYAKQQKVGS